LSYLREDAIENRLWRPGELGVGVQMEEGLVHGDARREEAGQDGGQVLGGRHGGAVHGLEALEYVEQL